MRKKTAKSSSGKRPRAARPAPEAVSEQAVVQPPATAPASGGSALNVLKQNLAGKRKAIFEILDEVKKVKPEQWRDPEQVEQLAKDFANKLGLAVPEQRIKQFVAAYKDATKNGPNADVDELVKKYGPNVDDKTLNEIKKFVPKTRA